MRSGPEGMMQRPRILDLIAWTGLIAVSLSLSNIDSLLTTTIGEIIFLYCAIIPIFMIRVSRGTSIVSLPRTSTLWLIVSLIYCDCFILTQWILSYLRGHHLVLRGSLVFVFQRFDRDFLFQLCWIHCILFDLYILDILLYRTSGDRANAARPRAGGRLP